MIKGFTNFNHFTKNQLHLLSSVIVAGIFLRVFHYLDNRCLWEDKVFLASGIIKMNFNELAIKPLDYQQRAPIGFLWMVRLGVVFFDKKEIRYPLGLSWMELGYNLPVLIRLLGVRELFLRQKQHLLLFASPVILALIASSLDKANIQGFQ